MRSVARHLVRRTPFSAQLHSSSAGAKPSFVGAQRAFSSKQAVTDTLQNYHDELLGCNWGDYLELVQNGPFFEAEFEKLEQQMQPFLNDPELGPKYNYVCMATDAMYACEDVRDHTNELLELMTRKTGILGMGINAGEGIENMDEQAQMIGDRYTELLKEFPEMKPKIEQCVGHGMAILRMKHKFKHPSGHRFFY